MSELAAAAEGLSRARAAYETRPEDHGRYVSMLEMWNRLLRAENRELRAALDARRRIVLPRLSTQARN